MQRHHRRIAAERIVFAGQLHEAGGSRLPFQARHLECEETGSLLRGRGDRWPHQPRDAGDCGGVEGFLVAEPTAKLHAAGLILGAEVVGQKVTDTSHREGQLEVVGGCGGPLHPAGNADRRRPIDRHRGVEAEPFKRCQPLERGKCHLLPNLRDDGLRLFAIAGVAELRGPFREGGHQPLSPRLGRAVAVPLFADFFENFSAGMLRRKILQQSHRETVLPDTAAESDFIKQAGIHQVGQPISFGGQTGQVGKVAKHAVESLAGVVEAFRLQAEPHHPEPFVGIGGVDAVLDHPGQHVLRNRRGGNPHVEQVGPLHGDGLEARPPWGDLRDALHDVELPAGRHQREDAAAVFVEGGRFQDAAHARDPPAFLRDPLGDRDTLRHGTSLAGLGFHHPPLRDHRAGQFVIADQDRRGRCFRRRGLWVDRHARQQHKPPIQHAAIGEFHPVAVGGGNPGDRPDNGPRHDDAESGAPAGGRFSAAAKPWQSMHQNADHGATYQSAGVPSLYSPLDEFAHRSRTLLDPAEPGIAQSSQLVRREPVPRMPAPESVEPSLPDPPPCVRRSSGSSWGR